MQYLNKKFPTVTSPAIFTTLSTHYLAKNKLSELSDQLGFSDYIIKLTVSDKINASDKEDVFESFIGALVTVADNNVQEYMGYIYAYQFVKKVYDREDIDIEGYQRYKTSVSVLKEMFDNKKEIYYSHNSIQGNGFYFTVFIDGEEVGTGTGSTVKIAKESASKDAIDKLSRRGLLPHSRSINYKSDDFNVDSDLSTKSVSMLPRSRRPNPRSDINYKPNPNYRPNNPNRSNFNPNRHETNPNPNPNLQRYDKTNQSKTSNQRQLNNKNTLEKSQQTSIINDMLDYA